MYSVELMVAGILYNNQEAGSLDEYFFIVGARSTDDLLSSQNNPSNKSSPQISSRSDKLSASQFTQHAAESYNGRSNVHEQQSKSYVASALVSFCKMSCHIM